MKKIFLFFLIFSLVGCKSKMINTNSKSKVEKPDFVKVNFDDINTVKKNRAYELGKRVLMTCNTSKFKPFTTEEATQEVINNINQDKISLTCQNILRKFGQFKDLKLIEAYFYEETGKTVFRFKCEYEKKYDIKELQVIINNEDKVASITTKNWKDAF